MKIFSGFPPGKVQVTPVPNLFFSELCPAIADLAELKLTLHLFWLFAQKKNRAPYVTAGELAADRTLMQSLSVNGADAAKELQRALSLATERGTLLRWDGQSVSGQAAEPFYFMNGEVGRRAYEKMEQTNPRETEKAGAGEGIVGPRPNVFVLYEQNIGLLTPMIAEELKEAERAYPPDWIAEAFKIAVENNKRSWSYARSILERWRTEGRVSHSKKGKTWYGDEYGRFVKR